MLQNDLLLQLFQTGAITVAELLENGAFPFADKLLQSIKSREQEMQKAQNNMAQQQVGQPQVGVGPGDIMSQIQSQSNPMIQ